MVPDLNCYSADEENYTAEQPSGSSFLAEIFSTYDQINSYPTYDQTNSYPTYDQINSYPIYDHTNSYLYPAFMKNFLLSGTHLTLSNKSFQNYLLTSSLKPTYEAHINDVQN
jgi:hypothetical protein